MEPFFGPPDVADGVNRSDIDCLLVALRFLLQQIKPDIPEDNEILELATTQYETDTEATYRNNAREVLDKSGLPDENSFSKEPQFIRTSECNYMQKIWSLPFAALWQPNFYTRAKTEGADWIKLAEKNDIFPSESASVEGLIEYKPAGLQADVRSLGALASTCHGIFDTPEFHFKMLPAGPAFMRIRFVPDGTRRFEDVCRFTYTVDKDHAYDYRICAAIRMRSTDEGHDMVRLYNSIQKPIRVMPAGSEEAKASYIGDSWKLGEEGHEYILYHVAVQVADGTRPRRQDPTVAGEITAYEKIAQLPKELIVEAQERVAQHSQNPTEEEAVASRDQTAQHAGNPSEEEKVAALKQIIHYALAPEDRL